MLNDSVHEMVNERGPRYAVSWSIRPNEGDCTYVQDAEAAEAARESREQEGYYNVKVWPPAGSVNLTALGRARADALTALRERTDILKAAVQRAAEEGRAEAEIARQAGVDRMTVRDWLGKGKRKPADAAPSQPNEQGDKR